MNALGRSDIDVSIDDIIKDLKELVEYGSFIIGVKQKDLHKLEKCVQKLEDGEYDDVIRSSFLQDGELC